MEPEPRADKVELWENRVFEAACHDGYFTVYYPDRPLRDRKEEFKDFPTAAMAAFNHQRAMVYAVSRQGRSTMLPRPRWKNCLATWWSITKTKRGSNK